MIAVRQLSLHANVRPIHGGADEAGVGPQDRVVLRKQSNQLAHRRPGRNLDLHLPPVERPGRNGKALAFDLDQMPPDKPKSSWWIDRKQVNKHMMIVRSIFTKIDMGKCCCSLDLFFDLYRNGKLQERYHEYGEVALISKSEITKLLEENSFNIEEIYGDFNKNKYRTNSPRIVLVTRKI